MARTYLRPGLVILVAAAAIGLAACSSGSSTPQVASLGPSSSGNGSGNSATAQSTGSSAGNPTQLLDQWTACMHSHGDPAQTDPTIDTNKDIHIPIPSGVKGLSHSLEAQACNSYLTSASKALGGGQSSQPPNPKLEKYAECMRDNGVPNFPDPTGDGFKIQGLDPNSLAFQNADEMCRKKVGLVRGSSDTPPPPGNIFWGTGVSVGNGGLGVNG